MKNSLFLVVLAISTFSCDSEDISPNTLPGTWKLSEVLADPGDGSGVFRPATTEAFINITLDGSYNSSFSLCSFGTADEIGLGKVDTLQKVFIPDDCFWGESPVMLPYELENGILTLNFVCIEPCGHRYVKATDQERISDK